MTFFLSVHLQFFPLHEWWELTFFLLLFFTAAFPKSEHQCLTFWFGFCRGVKIITVRKRKSASIQCKRRKAFSVWRGVILCAMISAWGPHQIQSERLSRGDRDQEPISRVLSSWLIVQRPSYPNHQTTVLLSGGGLRILRWKRTRRWLVGTGGCANSPLPCTAPRKCLRQIACWAYGSKDGA